MNKMNQVLICPSKSDAERALICSYLTEIQNLQEKISYATAISKADSRVANRGESYDVIALTECLKRILLHKISVRDDEIKREAILNLNTGASGANLRFLIPICAALGINAHISFEGRRRMITPMKEELEKNGISIEILTNGVNVSGRLHGGGFEIPGNVSSQFVSGLLFALPITEHGGKIIINGLLESAGYVNMTIAALRRASIEIKEGEKGYEVRGRQRYFSPSGYEVEGDWSNAAFWIAMNLILGIKKGEEHEEGKNSLLHYPIEITGLDLDSLQPDKDILQILTRFINADDRGKLILSGDNVIDVSQTPDLAPIISAVASLTEGTTLITNASRLRLKESNRIETICDVLFSLGIDIEETSDGLVIYGIHKLKGAKVKSYADHRIVMMAALMSQVCPAKVVIQDSDAVNKSYPEFKDELNRLGLDQNIEWR